MIASTSLASQLPAAPSPLHETCSFLYIAGGEVSGQQTANMLSTAAIRKADDLTAPPGDRRLRELLAQGERPDRATLIDWGCQLLEILAHAHARDVLHRHLTEDDVIITSEGRLILTGF